MAVFNMKIFNSEVFDAYKRTIPNLRVNALLKAGVFVDRTRDYKQKFAEQGGANYIVETIKGRIGGSTVNYDGATNITASSRDTFSQGKIVISRAAAWTERDFSTDITGGTGFAPALGEIAEFWDDEHQNELLSILKGIFLMSSDTEFTGGHTLDISNASTTNDADAQKIGATTLNTAIQKALGDNKSAFTVAIMHSAVATRLENLQLLHYAKYTDKDGIEKDMPLGTVNGKLVLIDDTMPTSGSGDSTVYTTYVLGKGAFEYCDAGAKVPFEPGRDPATNGGVDTLYTRDRVMFAPAGISFAPAQIPVSPTTAQLEAGTSWKRATSSDGSTAKFPHKAIPIARILCKV